MKKTRKKYTTAFKTQVVLAAIKERETLAELSQKYEVHSTQISRWKREFLSNATAVLATNPKENEVTEESLDKLYAKMDRLERERDFLKKIQKNVAEKSANNNLTLGENDPKNEEHHTE